MAGKKTHEQQIRTFERKDDVPDARNVADIDRQKRDSAVHKADRDERQSEFPVSRGGMNQESQHNKHNHPPKGG